MKVFRIVYRAQSDTRRRSTFVPAMAVASGTSWDASALEAGTFEAVRLESVELLDMPDGKQEEGKL